MNEDEDQAQYVRIKKTDFQKICKTIVSLRQRITELESIHNPANANKK